MTVEQLIEKLKQFDPSMKVFLSRNLRDSDAEPPEIHPGRLVSGFAETEKSLKGYWPRAEKIVIIDAK